MAYWFVLVSIIHSISFLIKKNWIFIIWVFLAFISAMRYNVGTDYKAYSQMFVVLVNGTATGIWIDKEIGYLWLVDIVGFFNGNYQMVFAIISISTITLFYKGLKYFFKKKQTYLLFGTLLFIPMFYFYSMNGIRQALATAIFFYSIKFIINRRAIKYFVSLVVAILFHKSAVILFPLYWLINIKYSKLWLWIYFFLGIIILVMNPLQIIMELFTSMKIPYFYYFKDQQIAIVTSLSTKIITISSFLIILIFSMFMNRNKPIENVVFNAMIFFILLRLITINMEVLNRLSVYFKPFFIVFVVFVVFKAIRKIKDSKNFLFLSAVMFIVIYSFFGIYYRASKDGSYNQYAINLCLIGKPCPLQIYGDYDNLYFKE